MQRLLPILAAWCLFSGLTGAWVGWRLDANWRADVEKQLLQDAQLVTRILQSRSWPAPPESDPAWRSLEEQLEAAIVPQYREDIRDAPQAAANDLATATDATAANGKTALASRPNVNWQRSAGERRVSCRIGLDVTTPALASGERTADVRLAREWEAVLITRVVIPSTAVGLWWQGWCLLNLVAFFMLALAHRAIWIEKASRRRILAPWVAHVRDADRGRQELLLPDVPDAQDELQVSMAIVSETVNGVHADLANARDRSELVFRNLQEGVLAVDDKGLVLLANKSLRRLLGVSSDNYLYRSLLEVVRVPQVVALVENVLKDRSAREVEVECGTEPNFLRISARPLPLGDSRHGALLTARDETLIKRVEMIRKDFVSNASHELKTPLAAIRAYAETLQLGALDDRPAAEKFVANIISQADRIDGLVQGMLQLARTEVGTAMNYQSFDVIQAMQPCLAANGAVAVAKGVTLLSPEANGRVTIRSDRDGFQTIVNNLLSNAVRYTEAGGEVEVRVWVAGDVLNLQVRDTGIGMRPADLQRVFERFYRAEKDRSADTGGTGLGLSMVKHLTQALGGTVEAESQLNVGSTFLVQLPTDPGDE